MPFSNQNTTYQPPMNPMGSITGPLMAMMLQNKMNQTPSNQVDPSQMQAMGQNQIPLGPTSGQMNPSQMMTAGMGNTPLGSSPAGGVSPLAASLLGQ